MNYFRYIACLVGIILFFPDLACSQLKSSAASDVHSIVSISPIFNQLIKLNLPGNFNPVPAFEKTDNDFYIQEHVSSRETIDSWTQMLTVTGQKDFAMKHPDATPKDFALRMAGDFQHACPSSFSGKEIYEGKLSAQDAFIVIASCGTAPKKAGHSHSETALIVVIKGDRNLYTLQWAQRGTPSPMPINIDVSLWTDRMKKLLPLKFCPIVPGEQPPYPSCIGKGN
jgi:hypothetical protein